jgi:hypothetical protein
LAVFLKLLLAVLLIFLNLGSLNLQGPSQIRLMTAGLLVIYWTRPTSTVYEAPFLNPAVQVLLECGLLHTSLGRPSLHA